MYLFNKMRSLLALVCLALVATIAVGCSNDADAAKGTRKQVVLLTVSQTCDYCAKHTATLKAAMAEAGVDLRVVVNEFNAADQAQQVTQAISTKPDAIVVWPADSRAIIPSLVRIKRAGIPAVVTNSYPQTEDTSLWKAYTGPNDIANGQAAARAMVAGFAGKGYGDSGNIVALVGPPGAPPTIDRLKGFEDEMAKLAPGIKVVGSQPGNWDQTISTSAAATLFTQTRDDDIKGMYSEADNMMAGALVAAQRQGIDPSKLVMVGHNCSIEGYTNINAGAQYASVLQSPIEDADLAAHATEDILAGKDVENVQYLVPRPITKDNVSDCNQAVGK
ncbi:sugar ABC transporter substrate-binding protein [Aldersonia sp. NBC_00410]|uniref:sugar ABC transporter substrate-binding protein n=1 Tax=Aldersonia sp. NBC_00410 TaxID=2975954 RepID=UPI00225959FA|nr:sugar ABC transporter substrate-binding protein [Aldersonia sp. NBC_00410]MCX5043468.1 sugar ABC transporter substrate-binding protein [Aldersonia sp. NBC_00410]